MRHEDTLNQTQKQNYSSAHEESNIHIYRCPDQAIGGSRFFERLLGLHELHSFVVPQIDGSRVSKTPFQWDLRIFYLFRGGL